MKIDLTYTLHQGTYAPYVDALRQGHAVSHLCAVCNGKTFPPRLCCDTSYNFHVTDNTATVLYRTDSGEKAVALVQFKDCENRVIAEIINPEIQGKRCVLVPPKQGTFGICIRIEPETKHIRCAY